MKRVRSVSLASLRPLPRERHEQDGDDAPGRIAARPDRHKAPSTAPNRRLMAAAVAVAMLFAGLSPLGEQTLVAAQEMVQEVIRAATPGHDAITLPGTGEVVDDPNAITVPYDPNAVEDIQPVP